MIEGVGRRSKCLEHRPRLLLKVGPGGGPYDGFHIGNALDGVAMPVGPVDDKGHLLGDTKLFERRVEVATVFDELICGGTTLGQLVRVTHADQVWRYAATKARQVGDDVAPQVGGSRFPCSSTIGLPTPSSTESIRRPSASWHCLSGAELAGMRPPCLSTPLQRGVQGSSRRVSAEGCAKISRPSAAVLSRRDSGHLSWSRVMTPLTTDPSKLRDTLRQLSAADGGPRDAGMLHDASIVRWRCLLIRGRAYQSPPTAQVTRVI
jgi:hypothetical protein